MEHKLHGKKRSYFFRKTIIEVKGKEQSYITITSSQRKKNGEVVRQNMQVFEEDLAAFIETLQDCSG